MRRCTKCNEPKPLCEFYKRESGQPRTDCKKCTNARSRAWAIRNLDYRRNYERDWKQRNVQRMRDHRKKWRDKNRDKMVDRHTAYNRANATRVVEDRYGMARGEFDERLAAQEGKCAICQQPSTRRLHVDHDHATGIIRGLLCGGCNSGIGHFRDSSDRLQAAIEYLEQFRFQSEKKRAA